MKVIIELSEAEVKGITEYLTETDGQKPTKKDIQQFIRHYVAAMYSPREAVSDYINKHQKTTL